MLRQRPRKTKARVIAATHRPLEESLQTGGFREDLYFRLKVVEIFVPALRERRGDIPVLTEHLLVKVAAKLHREMPRITTEAKRVLESHDWPGNVRELENALTRAAVLARGPVIDVEHLSVGASQPGNSASPMANAEDDTLETAEATHVRRILGRTGGNKRQAARILGISRPRLDRIIEKHGLEVL